MDEIKKVFLFLFWGFSAIFFAGTMIWQIIKALQA
jgi:hypothetical protein